MSSKRQTRVDTIFFVPISSCVFLSEVKHDFKKEKEVMSLKRQTRFDTIVVVPVSSRVLSEV